MFGTVLVIVTLRVLPEAAMKRRPGQTASSSSATAVRGSASGKTAAAIASTPAPLR
jgi:hypothetical protein